MKLEQIENPMKENMNGIVIERNMKQERRDTLEIRCKSRSRGRVKTNGWCNDNSDEQTRSKAVFNYGINNIDRKRGAASSRNAKGHKHYRVGCSMKTINKYYTILRISLILVLLFVGIGVVSASDPIISNLTNLTPMATTVHITWDTDILSNNTVNYSTFPDMSNTSLSSGANNTTSIDIKLWNLQPETSYYYQAYSYNATNESENSTSSIRNFTTQACVNYKFVNTSDTSQTGIDHLIQEAIDMICLGGGVVELAEGIWNITSPIWINKDNVTLKGQGTDKTTIQCDYDDELLIISKYYKWYVRNTWLYENNIKERALITHFNDHPDYFVYDVIVDKINFINNDTVGDHFGIGATETKDLLLTDLKISDATITGTYLGHSLNATVLNSIFIDNGGGISTGSSIRTNITNNTVSGCWRGSAIEFNGDVAYDGDIVYAVGNNITSNAAEGFLVYSSLNVSVSDNHVEDCARDGIYVYYSTDVEIIENELLENGWSGLRIDTKFGWSQEVKVERNIIYNNVLNGIYPLSGDGLGLIYVDIFSNTIYGNGDGIDNSQGHSINIKDNIIVHNNGAGIRGSGNSNSYNNVWNNSAGDYIGCTPGTGTLSVDPLFVDSGNHNFHLKSTGGHWTPEGWVFDDVKSPCTDAGDPADDHFNEPAPNGYRINMGAYGNTEEASKSSSQQTNKCYYNATSIITVTIPAVQNFIYSRTLEENDIEITTFGVDVTT